MFAIAYCSDNLVAPFTGAWIEIGQQEPLQLLEHVSPFTGPWIELVR